MTRYLNSVGVRFNVFITEGSCYTKSGKSSLAENTKGTS